MYILTWENYGKEKGHMKFEIIPHRTNNNQVHINLKKKTLSACLLTILNKTKEREK